MQNPTSLVRENLILRTLGIVMLLEYMDVSVLNTSLPQIAFSLHVNPINLKVALTVYLLTFSAFSPAAGWFADRFGPNRVLLIAIIGFLLSSIACGLSVNLMMLIIARAAQGIFAAFITPGARILVVKLFRDRRAHVFAKLTAIFLLGPLLGPLIGGAITTGLNWRFIFFVNVPIGLAALVIITMRFPTIEAAIVERCDCLGFILLALALLTALFAIDTLTAATIPLHLKLISLAISAGLFLIYYFHNKYKQHPVINLAVFKNKTFRFFSILLTSVRLLAMNMGSIGPLYVQTQLHYSALQAGLTMVPQLIGAMSASRTVAFLLEKFAAKSLLLILLNLLIASQLLISYCMLKFNLYLFLFALLITGAASSAFMSINGQFLYRDLSKQLATPGATSSSAIVQLSRGFAIAFIALILIASSGQYQLDWQTALPKLSYAIVMWIAAALLLLTMFSLKRMPK